MSLRRRPRRSVVGLESLESRLFLSTTTITAHVADTGIDDNGSNPNINQTTIRVGDNGTGASERSAIIPFQLPTLPAGATITSVSASIYLTSLANPNSLQGSMDLYGLGRRSSPTPLPQDYFRGDYGTDATDATPIMGSIADKYSTPGVLSLDTTGQANLLQYINDQYDGGAGAGQYVFLRLSHQVEQYTSRYWVVASANHGTAEMRPTLTITYEIGAAAPSGLTSATTGSGSIKLNWQDNSSNETGFTVERSADGTNWSTAGTVGANVTTFTDTTGLSADTKYYYRVRSNIGPATSDPSNTVTATTLPVFTNTRWVDVNYTGSTSNGGYDTPYKTIAAAISASSSGDGIVLKGGTYREAVNINKQGITLMGAPGERAIISGFEAIGGWTLVGGNTYSTTLNWKPTTLHAGYEPMELSREPDEGWWLAPTVIQNATDTTIVDPAHLTGIPSLVGGTVQMHVASGNNWGSRLITGHDTVNGTITVVQVTTMKNNDYYMVKNTTDLLDRPGEWAVKDNGNGTYTVFFHPRTAADLADTQARKRNDQQIRVTSTGSNSTIRNLEVTGNNGAGIRIGQSTSLPAANVTVHDVVAHNNGGAGIYSRWSTNLTIRNNVAVANGTTGITIVSTHNALVHQNDVAFNGVDGVIIAGDISGRQPGDPGFDPSTDVTVSNNYIHDHNGFAHSDGIQMYRWPENTKILNNFIARASQGIMTEQVPSAELTGNVVWNTGAYNVIFGHSNSDNWTVHRNTIGGAGYGPYNMSGTGYTMTENVYFAKVSIPSAEKYSGDRNLYHNPDGTAPIRTSSPSAHYTSIAALYAAIGEDQNSQIGDPQFENAPVIATVMENILEATTTSINVRSVANFAVGDKIQINADGVVRTITAIDVPTRRITFDVPLPMIPLTSHVTVENWKTNTNFNLDLRLKSTSPGATMGAGGGPIGSGISTLQFVQGDYDGDGVRDIPEVDSSVIAGLPGPNYWIPPSGI